MSVPAPMCPQCGQWMRPTDLHEGGERTGRIVGTCWKCTCGYMDPRYDDPRDAPGDPWDARDAMLEEEYRQIKAANPDRYVVYTGHRDGPYSSEQMCLSLEDAVAWANAERPGMGYKVVRKEFDVIFMEYRSAGVVARQEALI